MHETIIRPEERTQSPNQRSEDRVSPCYSNEADSKMSQVEEESKEKEECLWSPEGCIPLKLLVDAKKSEEYACYLCGMVCRDACEMVCEDHEEAESEDEEDNKGASLRIFGELCILKYLEKNSNKCPLTKHPNAKYDKSRAIRRAMTKLEAKCPNHASLIAKKEER